MLRLLALLVLSLPALTQAGAASAPDLPPETQALAALRSSPLVDAAGEHIEAQEARARRLAAGFHEWTLSVGEQTRRVRSTPGGTYTEWDVGLERALRLPGKRDLDIQLGTAGITAAQIGRGDALHEAGRGLLAGWFEWLREQAAAAQWQQQRDSLARQARVVGRRVELGDRKSVV